MRYWSNYYIASGPICLLITNGVCFMKLSALALGAYVFMTVVTYWCIVPYILDGLSAPCRPPCAAAGSSVASSISAHFQLLDFFPGGLQCSSSLPPWNRVCPSLHGTEAASSPLTYPRGFKSVSKEQKVCFWWRSTY